MLDLDRWQEVLETIGRNRLRTALTGFAVAWGIFILIVLLGSGEGLANGVEYQFRDDAVNSIWVRPGQTTLPHGGLRPGRAIRFTNRDHEATRAGLKGVEHLTSRFYLPGPALIAHGGKSDRLPVRCVHPDHLFLERTQVREGRFLNELDLRDHRKVAVIGALVERALFPEGGALGEEISVDGVVFRVVGVFEDAGGEGEMLQVYLPITTAQRTYGGADRIHQFMFTIADADLEESRRISDELLGQLAVRHRFSTEDRRAVSIGNNVENHERFRQLMAGIRAFVWLIGVGTILAGVVGVSNIMMITVRERTREFGVRKALGATPWSIVGLVLQEAVLITAVAGYLGLVLGVAALELVARLVPAAAFFRNPQVDLVVGLQATLLLVVAGTLAGLVPARRAAAIHPVTALRSE